MEFCVCERRTISGIGTAARQGYSLLVKNGIITNKMQVSNCSGWCDYVFDPNYRLMPLPLVKEYINANRHLPDTPSAEIIEKGDGIDVEKTIVNQQLKIEEIFLHLIDLQKQATALQLEYDRLMEENKMLKSRK